MKLKRKSRYFTSVMPPDTIVIADVLDESSRVDPKCVDLFTEVFCQKLTTLNVYKETFCANYASAHKLASCGTQHKNFSHSAE